MTEMITPSHGAGRIAPWIPGESGNPTGRPAGSLYPTEALRMLSGAPDLDAVQAVVDSHTWRGKPAHPILIATAKQLIKSINDGKLDSLEYITDRLEGKAVQTQRIGTEDDVRKVYHIDAEHHDGLPSVNPKLIGTAAEAVGEGARVVDNKTQEGMGPIGGD